MSNITTKEGYKLIIIPFCGFYESAAGRMLDDELERAFDYNDQQDSNIPDEIYFRSDYGIDWDQVREKFCIEYLDCFTEQFNEWCGLDIALEFESLNSPRYYNFSTDRLFAWISDLHITHLFTASEANNHMELQKRIQERFTSCDGFISSYSNDLGDWLMKPILLWDHNELETLLEAVLNIHVTERDQESYFDTYSLMENAMCNGNLSNWVWDAMPAKVVEFANLQRDHGAALDFQVFIETGQAFDPESGEEKPPLRYTKTLELPLTTEKE